MKSLLYNITRGGKNMPAILSNKSLKELREAKGIYTTTAFAEKLGLAKSTVCNYERGRRTPNLHTIVKIAQVLDISISEAVYIFLEKNLS